MTRAILMVVGASGASGLLIFLADSAVKGTTLLALAFVAAAARRGDSAAPRHLVWLVAVAALLVVPALSAVLPGGRVLPGGAGVSPVSPGPAAPAVVGGAGSAAA